MTVIHSPGEDHIVNGVRQVGQVIYRIPKCRLESLLIKSDTMPAGLLDITQARIRITWQRGKSIDSDLRTVAVKGGYFDLAPSAADRIIDLGHQLDEGLLLIRISDEDVSTWNGSQIILNINPEAPPSRASVDDLDNSPRWNNFESFNDIVAAGGTPENVIVDVPADEEWEVTDIQSRDATRPVVHQFIGGSAAFFFNMSGMSSSTSAVQMRTENAAMNPMRLSPIGQVGARMTATEASDDLDIRILGRRRVWVA